MNGRKLTHKLKLEVHERYESIDSIAADLLPWTAGRGMYGTHTTYKGTSVETCAMNFLTQTRSRQTFSLFGKA
jgi:hypothetical protein